MNHLFPWLFVALFSWLAAKFIYECVTDDRDFDAIPSVIAAVFCVILFIITYVSMPI